MLFDIKYSWQSLRLALENKSPHVWNLPSSTEPLFFALILIGNHSHFSVLQMRTRNAHSDLVRSACHAWLHSAGAGLKCSLRVRIVQRVLQGRERSGQQIIRCQDAEEYCV